MQNTCLRLCHPWLLWIYFTDSGQATMPASAPAKVEENGAVNCFQFPMTDFFQSFNTQKILLKTQNKIKEIKLISILLLYKEYLIKPWIF